MSHIQGRRDMVLTRHVDALRERLESCGVKFEFVPRGDRMEVRYEDTPQARAHVAEYRLPTWVDA